MKRQEWHPLKTLSLAICCMAMGIGIVAYLVSLINVSQDKFLKEQAAQIEKDKAYNLTHPDIVGTNENGEVIKRYFLPGYGHFIYEIGDTTTANRNLGKAGLQVTVEKSQ